MRLPQAVAKVSKFLETRYKVAEQMVANDTVSRSRDLLEDGLWDDISNLSMLNHAGRGVALTLLAYKACFPAQDVRAHKEEIGGGFSGRTVDTKATVPFLLKHNLPRSVETHWLTQTFSYAGKLTESTVLKTTPKNVGPLLIKVVNRIECGFTLAKANAAVELILARFIESRNRDRVALTIPKALEICAVLKLLKSHFERSYAKNAPRLPQCAIYETLAYYLRLLPSTATFLAIYTSLLNDADDVTYEHKIAWNQICETLTGSSG